MTGETARQLIYYIESLRELVARGDNSRALAMLADMESVIRIVSSTPQEVTGEEA